MTFKEFQIQSLRTIPEGLTQREKIINAALGISGEAGECADAIKKWQYQGHDYPLHELIEELGDVLYYIAMMATAIGTSLENVAESNVIKLKNRYPDGFDPDKSMHRTT